MIYRNTKTGVVVNTSAHIVGNTWAPVEVPAAADQQEKKATPRRRKAKTND